LVRHSFSHSEVLGLLCHVIVANVEHHMLTQFPASHLSTKTLLGQKGEDMSASGRLRNFWIPWVAVIVLGCFCDAVAQTSYKVTDLGAEGNDNLACAMSVNDGWTEIMSGNLPSGTQDSLLGTLLNGRE
jgi:hypothetical protein